MSRKRTFFSGKNVKTVVPPGGKTEVSCSSSAEKVIRGAGGGQRGLRYSVHVMRWWCGKNGVRSTTTAVVAGSTRPLPARHKTFFAAKKSNAYVLIWLAVVRRRSDCYTNSSIFSKFQQSISIVRPHRPATRTLGLPAVPKTVPRNIMPAACDWLRKSSIPLACNIITAVYIPDDEPAVHTYHARTLLLEGTNMRSERFFRIYNSLINCGAHTTHTHLIGWLIWWRIWCLSVCLLSCLPSFFFSSCSSKKKLHGTNKQTCCILHACMDN